MTPEMDLEQFEIELGRHGGDLAHWPGERRVAAAALIAASPQAAALQREALALDRLLLRAPPALVAAPADQRIDRLVTRIVALPQAPASLPAAAPAAWSLRGPRLRYAACLLAALTGFTIGALDTRGTAPPPDLLDLAFGPPGGGFDVR
jgi:hypothetical protein